ncbi:diacylglycerol lipase-beta isoform X2 [Mangifera indica]|uniref:diacylglycerol lipase-beta isoform X2 n=1 Tax=Mangifera indica TaxID=29780 RepID=UPI001CFB4EC1|nr:diacylglycerol lipase-beta isoform X2 [Mangifera indica]
MWLSRLKSLRVGTIVSGVANVMVVIVGGIIIFAAFPSCDGHKIFPIGIVSVAAGVKFCAMIKTGMAQEATAKTVLESAADTIIRHERRMRYRTWLWWTRFAIGIAFFQVVGATYLMFNMAKYVSDDGTSSGCILGVASNGNWWMKKLLVVFVIMVCFVALVQCFLGSDVLRWRSFYATQDDVWRAHYHEVFNHGIREILCCFGRIQYLTVSEEDEIYSVAKLLGDLVSYRASGTGHLELLAGLALLQRHSQSSGSYEGFPEAPQERLKEGAAFHKFAEAAYTGPLLDVGRNPILFPCAWLYRQGVLSPWTRSRRPTLDGDNWWRGHAAAFLKYVKLSPNVLQRGRVNQEECKAAYFILVLHHLKSVVIAVRGTETPEDLITDGLGRECLLSAEDLDGLMNNSHIHPDVKQSVESSSPHYGHRGIVEAARELYMQVEGNPINDSHDFGSIGFLSSLLGARCECDGYNVRLVGHSLGGSIATLLGLRLYGRFPNLHVYAYGALPCVDSVIANACTEFITSIVHENEFSARLSVRSIMRLRASAIMALTQDTTTDTALIFRLARRFLYASKYQISRTVANNSAENHSEINIPEDFNNHIYQGAKKPNRECSLLIEDDSREDNFEMDGDNFVNPYHNIAAGASPSGDPVSCLMETVSRTENGSATNPTELFLPGLIIHVVLQQQNSNIPLWASWRAQKRRNNYKAFIANRENFTDIVVSPSMFLDHMPWRCYHAMQNVLEARAAQESQAVVADEPRIL